MTLWNNEAVAEEISSDLAVATAIEVDLDIDSNNDGMIDPDNTPTGTDDRIEDAKTKPGKFIAANWNDDDDDGLVDYADFSNVEESFTPLVFEVKASIDFAKAEFVLVYDGSDPGSICPGCGPAPGSLRIWKVAGSVDRNKAAVKDGGDYFAPGTYTAAELGLGATRTITMYVEGIRAGAGLADRRIEFKVDPDADAGAAGGGVGFVHRDAVRVTVIKVDLDIDSDNTNGLTAPDRSANEDKIEDADDKPGKFLAANIDDADADGVPDWADGFNADGTAGNDDDQNLADKFIPLVIEIAAPIDLTVATLKFEYNNSDPGGVTEAGGVYTPAAGHFRVWMKDGSEPRGLADYVAPGDYTATELDMGGTTRERTFYVEGIAASAGVGAQRILVQIDPDGASGPAGFLTEDGVRLTVFSLEILDAAKASTEKLKVAKWQNGYAGNPPTVKADFIDFDPDRFYVRVTNVAANTDPATIQRITTVKISTDSPGADYDDDPDAIELTETGVDTGVFESKSVMLMADDVDDDHKVDGIMDDDPNDRTHEIALDGILKAEYEAAAGTTYSDTAKVPVEKTLTLPVIYILRETAGGAAVTTQPNVEADIKWANERYAQAGVLIKVTEIKIEDPPAGVDLSDGSLDEYNPDLTAEEKALFDKLGTADRSDIIVFYVNQLSLGSVGESTAESQFPGEADKRVNNSVIAAQHPALTRVALAHELLHPLINSGDHPDPSYNVLYRPRVPADLDDSDVNKVRRLSPKQATTVLASKFVKDP